MENDNNNPSEQVTDSLKNAGNKVVNKGKQVAKDAVKKAGKKILAKAGKVALKLTAKSLLALAPYLLPILFVIGLAVFGYYVLFEIRGTQQIYTYDKQAQNQIQKDANTGVDKTSQSTLSGQTEAIQTYYKYMSQHSYKQIITNDNTKLQNPDDTKVMDYYNKEQQYYLNSNLLFALDETMHQKKFIYPEQFVKPVNYDPAKLELKPLTDKFGRVTVDSVEYDADGNKTGKKVKSVSDYGIGSIFKYKKDQKNVTVEGVMYKKEVWDDKCNCKKTENTNQPFNYTMDGYPQEIWLMTKAVTFVGEFSFQYQNQKTQMGDLSDNQTPGKDNEAVKKVQVGQGKKMKTEYYYETEYYNTTETYTDVVRDDKGKIVKDDNGKPKTEQKTREVQKSRQVKKSRQVFDKWVPLYGYRKGGIYQTIPVASGTTPNDKGQDYLNDFLYNYNIFIPKSVLGDFNLQARGVTGTGMTGVNMDTGSGKNSSKLTKSMQYFGIAQQYGKQFGVNPYLIVALMAQESGGDPTVNYKGLMQIIGHENREITATDTCGKKQSFTITDAGRQNPNDAIHWGTMYLKYLIDFFDGDPVKATLAYNMGEGTVDWIRKHYPADWKTDNWASHIPEANSTMISGNGDNDYLSHVFQYYVGPKDKKATDTSCPVGAGNAITNAVGGLIDTVNNAVKSLYSALVSDYSKEKTYYPYHRYVSQTDIDWALHLGSAMDNYVLFSQTFTDATFVPHFWDTGFDPTVTNGGDSASNYVATENVDGYQIPVNVPNPASLITSLPGWRSDPFTGARKFHQGTDIAVPKNTPVYATADGKVLTASDTNNGYGVHVVIQHANDINSLYGHLTSASVHVGDTVKKGQLIGYSGSTGKSTGPHLHFEMRKGAPYQGVILDTSLIVKGVQGKLQPAPTA